MTRERVLVALGILVLISPWSGLPLSWLKWFLLITGIIVIAIAISLRGKKGNTSSSLPSSPPTQPPVPLEAHQSEVMPSSQQDSAAEPKPRSSHIAFS